MKLSLNVLKDPKAPIVALLGVTFVALTPDKVLTTDPTFLRQLIEESFNVELSDLQADKINAGVAMLNTNGYQDQHEVFSTFNHLLNNTAVDFSVFEPLEAEELATGLAHYSLVVGGDEEKLVFSPEVRAYAGHVFYEYGFSEAPAIFPQAIMPTAAPSSPVEKNQALSDLWAEKTKAIKAYLLDVDVFNPGYRPASSSHQQRSWKS